MFEFKISDTIIHTLFKHFYFKKFTQAFNNQNATHMIKLAFLWVIAFSLTALSVVYTFNWVISPIWVVNAVMGYYLIQLRHSVNHPVFHFGFVFSIIFLVSIFFDPVKDMQTIIILSVINGVQVSVFIQLYYWIRTSQFNFRYIQTRSIAIPSIISAAIGGLIFMLMFEIGLNHYEFFDYFLEQVVTCASLICVFYGWRHWNNIEVRDYIALLLAWAAQYYISKDPIFYACFIFPLLLCYFALKYQLKAFSFVAGLLVFVCSVYISLPLVGQYWTAEDVHILSRLSSYRLALGCYLLIFLFVCEIYLNNKRLSASYERMMFRDELTGLKNRRYVREKVLNDASFQNGYLLLLDIDNFKKVNDVHGHYVGDLVIQHVTQILLKMNIRHKVIVRWGGEEFLILVPDASVAECRALCERILEACFETPFQYKDCRIDVTVSIGATTFGQFTLVNYAHWIHEADICLYEAKARGKKIYVLKA